MTTVDAPPAALRRPSVPRFVLGEFLGTGSAGSVWAATDASGSATDGEQVAIKILTPEAASRLGPQVEALRALDDPGVVRLRDVVACDAGTALVLDRPSGGSLAALLAVRGGLRAGEVSTLVCGLAGALARLHARGLVHGALSPTNVMLDERGEPLLCDVGLSAGAPPTAGATRRAAREARAQHPSDPARRAVGPADASTDVHALAATARAAAGAAAGDLPPALAALLREALATDPAERPSAADLDRRCRAAVQPTPLLAATTRSGGEAVTARLRLVAAAAVAEPPAGRGQRRRLAVAAAIALPVTVGVVAALAARGPEAGAPAVRGPVVRAPSVGTPAASTTPSTPAPATGGASAAVLGVLGVLVAGAQDPAAAVTELARLRDAALAARDAAALTQVDLPGSLADRSDRALVDQLVTTGTLVSGRTSRVTNAVVTARTGASAEGDQAWVRVTVVTSAHSEVSASGAPTAVPQSRPVTSLLLLTRQGGRWLIAGSG